MKIFTFFVGTLPIGCFAGLLFSIFPNSDISPAVGTALELIFAFGLVQP